MKLYDWYDFSGDSGVEDTPLLISIRSQSLILSALEKLQPRWAWIEVDDGDWDDIDGAIASAINEVMKISMPDFTPVGSIAYYPDETLPTKWIMANGDFVLQSAYPDLYAICGSKFGTPSAGRFYLPNLVDRFAHGASADAQIGVTGGSEAHALTTAELPVHAHGVLYAAGTGANTLRMAVGNNTGTGTTPSANAGSGAAHNNMPPYLRLMPMIKALP